MATGSAFAVSPWRFFLADATGDILNVIGELSQARSRSLSISLLSPGSASLRYPITAAHALDITEIETCIMVMRDNKFVWSGPIMQIVENYSQKTIEVSAVGWLEELDYRIIRPGQEDTFTNRDSTEIAYALLAKANAQTDVAGNPRPTAIKEGAGNISQARTRSYQIDQTIGESIRELATVENGFDFHVDPVQRELNIYYPRYGTTRSDVIFAFNWGPANLRDLSVTNDGFTVRNRHTTRNKFGNRFIAEDISTMARYRMREETSSIDDPGDDVPLAYAGGEVAVKSNPRQTFSFSLLPGNRASVPRLFLDFNIGDICKLVARGGRRNINGQNIRIFGATVSSDDNTGLDSVTSIETAPS